MSAKIVVLASGGGTNLQALLDAIAAGKLDAKVVAVISHRPNSIAMSRAQRHGIPAHFIAPPGRKQTRERWDEELAALVQRYQPDFVYLLGWMRVLGEHFLKSFPLKTREGLYRVLNLHPALPGELPGTDAIARAHFEAEQGKRSQTGAMVHLVTTMLDEGPVLAFDAVKVSRDMPLEELEEAIQAIEHRITVEAAQIFIDELKGQSNAA